MVPVLQFVTREIHRGSSRGYINTALPLLMDLWHGDEASLGGGLA